MRLMDQELQEERSPEDTESAARDGETTHADGPGVDLNERVSRLHDATLAHLSRLRGS